MSNPTENMTHFMPLIRWQVFHFEEAQILIREFRYSWRLLLHETDFHQIFHKLWGFLARNLSRIRRIGTGCHTPLREIKFKNFGCKWTSALNP